MKNFFAYTLIILISGSFLITGLKEKKITKTYQQIINKTNSEIDTAKNKLPKGHLYITNFNLSNRKKIKSISQDNSGVMLFLTGKGIIFYDGKTEKELFIENSPNTIKKDKILNQFYIVGRKAFGIVKKDNTGKYRYKQISEKKDNRGNYKKIIVGDNSVWLISKQKIEKVSTRNLENIKTEYQNSENTISGAFFFDNKLYFSIQNKGLHFISNDTVIFQNNDSLFLYSNIIFSIPFNNSVILGTSDNDLFLFNGKSYKTFKTNSDNYIKESVIIDGINISKSEFAITTLNGGAIIINKETGVTNHTINYRTGLPDDEIYSASIDNNNGLWLSHDYGISRVAIDIPVTNYGFYPGLEGKINFIKVYDSTLYVATGEGLFRLKEIKSYDEVEIASKKWVKSRKKIKNKNYTPNVSNNNTFKEDNEETTEDDIEETGFLKRWKKRRKKKKEEEENEIGNDEENNNTTKNKKSNYKNKDSYKTVYKAVTEYKKTYELQSVRYTYSKVEGINSKCKHLKTYAGGLLVSTNSGLFFSNNNELQTLIKDAYIYNISGNDNDRIIFSASSNGLYKISKSNKNIICKKINNEVIQNISFNKVFKENDSTVWGLTLNNLYLLKINGYKISSFEKFKIDIDPTDKLFYVKNNGKEFFLTSGNAFYYSNEFNDIIEDEEYFKIIKETNNFYPITDTSIILTNNKSVIKSINVDNKNNHLKYLWLIDNLDNINIDDNGNIWAISHDNLIYKISKKKNNKNRKFELYISSISDNAGNSFSNFKSLEIESGYKNINVHLSSPAFLKKDFIRYSYGVDSNAKNDFIEFSDSQIIIPELSSGNHIIYFQAINDLNEESELIEIKINIKPPFWQTKMFIIGLFSTILILITLIISAFYRRKQRKIKEYNEILELKVKERTIEIEKQNEQIQAQNNEIYNQYEKINTQNKEITSSIRYAGKIQKAALPNLDIYKKYLSGFFNLYMPRDIVSGDFYWINETQNKLFIAAVDCTGHGVPGGFLSMLGISFLNEIVIDLNRKKKYIRAANILNILREKIISTLSQQGDQITRDGMDMALVVIDKEKKMLNFAGANNPAYIIRDNKLTKVDADRMPIGYNKKFNDVKFKDKFIKILKDDTVYIFSDGYADQFGGEYSRKFNLRRFRELLMHINKFPMPKQKEIAERVLKKWKRDHEQIDDILLIGIKI